MFVVNRMHHQMHNSVNTGKRSLAVDLTDPRGQALVHELIDTADVVINNFRPGAHPEGPWGTTTVNI